MDQKNGQKKIQDPKSTKYLQKIEHTGDSCFYIGLGNTKTNTPSFEPYQCCPKPQTQPEKEKTVKTVKPAKKEDKNSESKSNGKRDESKSNSKRDNEQKASDKNDNKKKKEKRNKKENGEASWWW